MKELLYTPAIAGIYRFFSSKYLFVPATHSWLSIQSLLTKSKYNTRVILGTKSDANKDYSQGVAVARLLLKPLMLSVVFFGAQFVSAQQVYWTSHPGNGSLPFAYGSPLAACRAGVAAAGFSYSSILPSAVGPRFFLCLAENPNEHLNSIEELGVAQAISLECPTNPALFGVLNPYARPFCLASGENSGDSCNNSSNPINIATGNKYYEVVDYQDADFLVSRHYNSYNVFWTFNYTQNLSFQPAILGPIPETERSYTGYLHSLTNGVIKSVRADGASIEFQYGEIATDVYTGPPQRTERLNLADPDFVTEVIEKYEDGEFTYLSHTHDLVLADRIERYDSEGKLAAISVYGDADTNFTYGEPHEGAFTAWPAYVNITRNGKTLQYRYNDQFKRVDEIVLPNGNILRYSYEEENTNGSPTETPHGALLSVVLEDVATGSFSELNRYLYEGSRPSGITGVIDENGNRTFSVSYDAQARAVTSERGEPDSGIERVEITYNSDGTRTLTNALGKQTTYTFIEISGEYKISSVEGHPSANCAASNHNTTYDTNGYRDLVTDWEGNVTDYDHDNQGQEISRTEGYGTAEARIILTEWHTDYRLPTKITYPEKIVEFAYDSNGNLLNRTESPNTL